MKKYIIILVVLIVGVSSVKGQQSYKKYKHQLSNSGMRSIGMTIGAYLPGMDYYKNQTGFDFKSALSAGINAEYYIYKPISIRAGINYFSTTAKTNGTATFNEETTVSAIPFNLDVIMNISNATKYSKGPATTFYFGAGVDLNLLNVKYKSTASSQTVSGKYTSYHAIVGLDYGKGIRIGPEIQYVIGKYSQDFLSASDVLSTQDIEMKGLKLLVKISYDL
jgi:hypothetical protein